MRGADPNMGFGSAPRTWKSPPKLSPMPQEFSGIELEYVTGWIVQIPVVSKKMAQIIFRGIERKVRKIIWFVAAYQRKRCAFAAGPCARYPAAAVFFFFLFAIGTCRQLVSSRDVGFTTVAFQFAYPQASGGTLRVCR